MQRIIAAFCNSRDGLLHAARTEKAVQQEIALLLAAVPLAVWLGTDNWKRAVLIGSVLAVIVVELLNTCVEKLSDHVTPEIHPQIKIVKDMGSAAVFFAIVAAVVVWGAALWERVG